MRPPVRAVAAASLLALPSLHAQQVDSLRLAPLQAAAMQTDPRQRQIALQATQTQLRTRNIDAERLPVFSVEGLAQYQSEVIQLPRSPGSAIGAQTPPHDTWDAKLVARETLFDPTLKPRLAAERAALGESQAQVRTTLFSLRQEVDDAFFTAAVFDARANELRAGIVDLQGRRRDAVVRVREGAALPSDTSSLDAAILQRGEDERELRANRSAALARLARLTGQTIDDRVVPVLPDLAALATQARASLDAVRARPEYAQFAASRQRIASQSEVLAAKVKPNLSTFARFGYGKPGLNPLSNNFDTYWIAGMQMQWTPITWGALDREREALVLQQQIVSANEAAFAAGIRRAVEVDLQNIDRLEATLATDDQIIALREQVERETRARLQEGVVTAADYVTRNTELLQARLARATHRVALSQSRAHFLSTLGLEIR